MFECKRTHCIAGSILAVVAIALTVFLGFKTYQTAVEIKNYAREITVDAQGVSFAAPDIATVSIGVNTEGATADKTVESNTKKMNDVIAKIKELGVENKDIQTTTYYLNPKYSWTQEKGSFQDGYTVNQDVTVKVRDLSKVGEILTAVTKTGANVVGNVSFSIEDPEKAKTEAREMAIAKAKEKAEMIAQQTGLKLGKVTNYYEYQEYGYYGKGAIYPTFAEGGGMMDSAAMIEPGTEEVKLNVTLTYKVL